MLHWFMLPVSGVTGITNRLWRGEGEIPRYQWYLFMVALAVLVSAGDGGHGSIVVLMLIWLLYFLGYALLPWQAMFSAITGEPPSRKDAPYIQWLQDLTYKLCNMDPNAAPGTYTPDQWRKFGVVYGTLRASFMLPGVICLAVYAGSPVPLAGVACLLMGCVYYMGYKLSMHFTNSVIVAVPLSEMTMGWWHGTFMLICATVI